MSQNNILQVVRKSPTWGFDLFLEIAHAYHDQGHNITTVFLNGAKNSEAEAYYPGETVFLELDHKRISWRFKAFWYLFGLCASRKFDATICHHYKPSAIMALVDRIRPVKKLFMVNHNPGNLRKARRRLAIRYLFSKRWKFLTVSNWVKEDFLNRAPWLTSGRVIRLYNCIDIDNIISRHLAPENARDKLGLPLDSFIFGNIHRLDPSKGHDYMIRAFADAFRGEKGVHLCILGGGERKIFLEELAVELDVGDQVHLAGLVPHASDYARAFDSFIIPSLHEGFGLGLLEAMAAKLPVISSTGGALPEVTGDTALQFSPGNVAELKQRLLQAYRATDEERSAMGVAAFERLTNNFSKHVYHRNFIALLNS